MDFSLLWLCLAALFAGAVNALAGGGTLLTFPALFAALTPNFNAAAAVMANGTSTVALAPASLGSSWGFRREVAKVRRWLALLIVPSLIGGLAGALLASKLSPKYFNLLVPWLILTAAILFTLQPLLSKLRSAAANPAQPAQPPSGWTVAGIVGFQLLVALYGGYFGAGIGILMLTSLGFLGLADIHEMNALKNVLASCINLTAAAVFIFDGRVVWHLALMMTACSILGGYLAARWGRKLKPAYVRALVIGIGFSLAAFYFWRQWTGA